MNSTEKIIVITGASRGLGKAVALKLAERKANLILIARTKHHLVELKKEIKFPTDNFPIIIECDISNEDDVNKMADIIRNKFQKIDILINNAGIGIHKTFEKTINSEMIKQFEVNFFGTFYCIKALLPLIKKSESGYILNIGSLVSKVSFPDNSIYASTKCALSGFTQGLRMEMKKSGIKVGIFLPGIMNTTFGKDKERSFPKILTVDIKKAAKKIEKMIKKRQKELYFYRWMLLQMRIGKLFYR